MLIDVWNTTVIIVRYGAIKISNLYKFEIHMPVIKLDLDLVVRNVFNQSEI